MRFALDGLPAGCRVLNAADLAPSGEIGACEGWDSVGDDYASGQLPNERRFRITLSDPGVGRHAFGLIVSADGMAPRRVPVTAEVLPSLGLPKADRMPAPKPVKTGKYEIGAFLFPGWDGHQWHGVWTRAPHRKPVLGWYDETNPEVIDWQIKHLVENGVSFVFVDWYWSRGRHSHGHWPLAFGKARYRGLLKWSLMWANHNRSDVFRSAPGKCNDRFFWKLRYDREEFLEAIDYCIREYFGSPQYYRKDDRLFLSIYSAMQLVNGLGGPEAAKAVFAEAQKRVKDAGLPPLHLSAMIHGKEQADVVNAAGFDSTAAYNVTPYDFDDSEIKEEKGETRQLYSHEEFAELHGPFNRKMAEFSRPPYIPVVARGWDASPRCRNDEPFPWKTLMYPYLGIVRDTAPKWFRRSLEIVKAQALADPKKPGAILINAWNEYTEGCYLMPDTKNGDAYLKAIKSVFGD